MTERAQGIVSSSDDRSHTLIIYTLHTPGRDAAFADGWFEMPAGGWLPPQLADGLSCRLTLNDGRELLITLTTHSRRPGAGLGAEVVNFVATGPDFERR